MRNRAAALTVIAVAFAARAQSPALSVSTTSGLRLHTIVADAQPALALQIPGYDTTTPAIRILFPEHVTVVPHGAEPRHLYLHDAPPRAVAEAPRWLQRGDTLGYERQLADDVQLSARAILAPDGIRIRYVLTNHSSRDFDAATVVTDPRMLGALHDAKLERTWVHLSSGFELLASETPVTPARGPARYLASYAWPIPAQRAEHRADGITYFTKSRRVDAPFIATTSVDGQWVVASYSRDAGNVWSNPDLTCQHVDPSAPLAAGATATLDIRLIVLRGGVQDAFARAR